MGYVLAIVSKGQFEKLAGKDAQPGTMVSIDRYDSLHKALEPLKKPGALFLVTVRPPDDALWLVAVLEVPEKDAKGWTSPGNNTAIADISALKGKIRFTSGAGISAKPGALGMSLQTPRELSKEDVELLRGVQGKAKAAFAKKASAKAKPPAKAPPKAKAPAAPKSDGQLSGPGANAMIEGAIAQLGEVIADAKESPKKYLAAPKWKTSYVLRGLFTESVQSIYSGAVDAKEACRMLGEELAPFIDGESLALVLRAATEEVTDADNLYGEVVDQFAIRAMDDLARGLFALALDRPEAVPLTCARYRSLLERHVASVKAMLA